MMGTKIREFAPLPDLSLEDLVPKDNFYRRLEERLDLSFVRELVEDLYAPSGRPSVDPVVFFKLELVLFFEDLRSERQLMEVVADRLSLRWYLGYDLHEPLPDHSSLTRIRERYGLEIFRSFFDRIVQMCIEAGLVWGEELFVDSTTVRANAAKATLIPRLTVLDHRGLTRYRDDFQPGARRYDVGERSNPVLLPMGIVALRQLLDWGVENVAAMLGRLTSEIAGRARELGFEVSPVEHRAGHLIGLRRKEGVPDDLAGRRGRVPESVRRGVVVRATGPERPKGWETPVTAPPASGGDLALLPAVERLVLCTAPGMGGSADDVKWQAALVGPHPALGDRGVYVHDAAHHRALPRVRERSRGRAA